MDDRANLLDGFSCYWSRQVRHKKIIIILEILDKHSAHPEGEKGRQTARCLFEMLSSPSDGTSVIIGQLRVINLKKIPLEAINTDRRVE